MRKITNAVLIIIGLVCLMVITLFREKVDLVLVNLSYSYLIGMTVYLFAVAIPDWSERMRLHKIVEIRIDDIGVMLTNLLVGFPKGCNLDVPDIGDSKRCRMLLTNVDWNIQNSIPLYPHEGNKLYQTFYSDYRDIQFAVHEIIMCYRGVLSVRQLKLLEEMRNARFMSLLEVSVIYNSCSIAKPVSDEVAKGFCEILEVYRELRKTSGI